MRADVETSCSCESEFISPLVIGKGNVRSSVSLHTMSQNSWTWFCDPHDAFPDATNISWKPPNSNAESCIGAWPTVDVDKQG